LLKEQFVNHLLKAHPTLKKEALDELISPLLISPFEIRLPAEILEQAQRFVKAAYELRENAAYQAVLSKEMIERDLKDPGNKSICMSYDFHLDANNTLKLIEINTNAAFQTLGYEMYKMRNLPLPIKDFSMDELRRSIETEMKLQGKQTPKPFQVAVIDEQPQEQRLFAEFLVCQAYFEEWGWKTQIADYRNLEKADFVYNRFTDFYLNQPESKPLREAFLNRSLCLSPNPYEYFLLADKQRMIDWCDESFWQKLPENLQQLKKDLQFNLPETKDMTPKLGEDIWAQRKKYFFKPKRAYGAKQSYRGGTISHKAFDDILNADFIAQEYIPAPELKFQSPDGELKFKYDLRFYVYQSRIQMAVGRLYQGQVTNLKSPYGGFTPVLFE
jgi:hypothetical protein